MANRHFICGDAARGPMIITDCGNEPRLSPESSPRPGSRKIVNGDALLEASPNLAVKARHLQMRDFALKNDRRPPVRVDENLEHEPRDLPVLPDRRGRKNSPAGNRPVINLIEDQHRDGLSGVEETILELYHGNLSVSKLATLTKRLGNARFALSNIAGEHRQAVKRIDLWRKQPITREYSYVFLAEIELNCNCGYEKKSAGVLVAMGVDEAGVRRVLGVAEGGEDFGAAWLPFLHQLKDRGLRGVRLFVCERPDGPMRKLRQLFPGTPLQRSVVNFNREVLSRIPIGDVFTIEKMLDEMAFCPDRSSASLLAGKIQAKLHAIGLPQVAEFYETQVWSTLHYLTFPNDHWRSLRTNSALTELLRRLRERTRKVGAFSDGASAVHLVSARLRHIEDTVWKKRPYTWSCF